MRFFELFEQYKINLANDMMHGDRDEEYTDEELEDLADSVYDAIEDTPISVILEDLADIDRRDYEQNKHSVNTPAFDEYLDK